MGLSQDATPQLASVPIRLDSGGIEPLGTGLRIDFGRHQPGVIETVSRLQGEPPSSLIDCSVPGVAAALWDDGLALVFRNNAFAGWRDGDAIRSATGSLSAGVACTG